MPSRVPASPGLKTLTPPCRWRRTRSRLVGGIAFGVTMKAFTSPIMVGSTLTPNASRSRGNVATTLRAASSTLLFQSTVVSGTRLKFGLKGLAMTACIWGLTVSGTGIERAGTSRVLGGPDCAAAGVIGCTAGSTAAPAARCRNCLRWGCFIAPSHVSSRNAWTNAQSVHDERPADSTSAAHCDDREFGTSRWQLCCYILLKFAYTRKGANVASWHIAAHSQRGAMSAVGRYCCKSRKLQGSKFLAKTLRSEQSLIRMTSIALP